MRWPAKIISLSLSVLFSLLLSACSNSEGKAQKIYETAQFEELQTNIKHAKQLYQEILRDHPETAIAIKAKARLAELALQKN
ncbi:MAG: hypothetical protein ACE5FY_06615 [Nitrospiria bacterium]